MQQDSESAVPMYRIGDNVNDKYEDRSGKQKILVWSVSDLAENSRIVPRKKKGIRESGKERGRRKCTKTENTDCGKSRKCTKRDLSPF